MFGRFPTIITGAGRVAVMVRWADRWLPNPEPQSSVAGPPPFQRWRAADHQGRRQHSSNKDDSHRLTGSRLLRVREEWLGCTLRGDDCAACPHATRQDNSRDVSSLALVRVPGHRVPATQTTGRNVAWPRRIRPPPLSINGETSSECCNER